MSLKNSPRRPAWSLAALGAVLIALIAFGVSERAKPEGPGALPAPAAGASAPAGEPAASAALLQGASSEDARTAIAVAAESPHLRVVDRAGGRAVPGIEIILLSVRSIDRARLETQLLAKSWSPLAALRELGQVATADAGGLLSLEGRGFPLFAAAARGDDFGWTRIDGDAATGVHELALGEGFGVTARVLDARGLPTPGAPVRFRCVAADGAERLLGRLETDASGEALLRGVSPWVLAAAVMRALENPCTFQAGLDLGARGERVSFEPAPQADPVLLRMPPTAALDVSIRDAWDRPPRSRVDVSLRALDAARTGDGQSALASDAARASFPFVQPGALVEIRASASSFSDQSVALLPRVTSGDDRTVSEIVQVPAAGARNEVVLRFDAVELSCRARLALLDPAAPLPAGRVEAQLLFSDAAVVTRSVSLSEAGECAFAVWLSLEASATATDDPHVTRNALGGRPELERALERVRFVWTTSLPGERARDYGAEAPVDVARQSEVDLGTLLLEELVPLVAGRVRDESGSPLPGVRIDVEVDRAARGDEPAEPSGPGDQPPAWAEFHDAATTDAQGRFRVVLIAGGAHADPTERWTLRAHAREHLPISPLEFAAGEQELELTLQPMSVLRGELHVDPALAGEEFRVRVARAAGGSELALRAEVDHGGSFELRGAPYEGLELRIEHAPSGALLTTLRDVHAWPLAEPREPLAIDLRGRLAWIQVELARADQAPLEEGFLAVLASGSRLASDTHAAAGAARVAQATRHTGPGPFRLVVAEPVDVLVGGRDCRTRIHGGLDADTTITLEPGIPATFALEGAPLASEARPYTLRLVAVDLALGGEGATRDVVFTRARTETVRLDRAGDFRVFLLAPAAEDGSPRTRPFSLRAASAAAPAEDTSARLAECWTIPIRADGANEFRIVLAAR
jgi:hypothetical protein